MRYFFKKLLRQSTFTSGFSLMEVLVIVGLIGIISTFILVSYSRIGRFQALNRATEEVAIQFRKAQNYALTTKTAPGGSIIPCGWGVFLEKVSSSAVIYYQNDVNSDGCSNEIFSYDDIEDGEGGIYDFPSGITISSITVGADSYDNFSVIFIPPDPKVIFFGLKSGSLDIVSGTNVQIKLNSPSVGEGKVIQINRSGQVSIQ